jgi:anti-sigma-K factor RskA
MNYNNQKMIDMLAAEYVLGTMVGRARERFSRLLLSSEMARKSTWQWEQNLNNLAGSIERVKPEPQVWEKINQRIEQSVGVTSDLNSTSADRANVTDIGLQSTKASKPQTTRFWQTWSLAASIACFALAAILWQGQPPVPSDTFSGNQIAVFQDETKTPLWLVDVNETDLTVKASDRLQPQSDKDYELWMILKGQPQPISLGLLPKDGSKSLLKNSRFNANDIALLAVSLEPLGGSPSGSPTEVLYTTELIVL